MALIDFLGRDLVTALGRLNSGHVLGPWRGHTPAGKRKAARFVPALYGDDHAHDHGELCLLLEGHCLFSYDHKACVLKAGDLVICPAGKAHAEAFVKAGESYRLVWLSLHPQEPGLHVTRYARRGGFVMDHQLSFATLPAESRTRLQALRAVTCSQQPPEVDELREALLSLTLALFRRALEGGEAQMDTRAQLVGRAAEFVRINSGRALSLSEVARAVHVSPNYLTGLFRAQSGVPLGRFILEERVARARERLRDPEASVKAVAFELGFGDPFAFSRAFKRVTGRSPSAWLASARGPVAPKKN